MSDKPIVELMAAARQQHDRICEDEYGVHPDCAIVARFVRQHGRAPEHCTRCEQWEGICWHHPTNQPVPTQENETR